MSDEPMDHEAAEEFTQALGKISQGGWEMILLAQKHGIPKTLGFSSTEEWAAARLGGYQRLAIDERRQIAAHLSEEEGLSTRQIAGVLGIGKDTVRRDLAGANAPDAPPPQIQTDPENAPDAPPTRPRKASGSAGPEWVSGCPMCDVLRRNVGSHFATTHNAVRAAGG